MLSHSRGFSLGNYCKVGSTSEDVSEEEPCCIQEDFLIKKYCYKVWVLAKRLETQFATTPFDDQFVWNKVSTPQLLKTLQVSTQICKNILWFRLKKISEIFRQERIELSVK